MTEMDPRDVEILALQQQLTVAQAEVERLKGDLQGIILERDQLLDIQKENEAEVERLRAELDEQKRNTGAWCEQAKQAEARLREVVEALRFIDPNGERFIWPLAKTVAEVLVAAQPEEESCG